MPCVRSWWLLLLLFVCFLLVMFLRLSPGTAAPAPSIRPATRFLSDALRNKQPPAIFKQSKSEIDSDRSRSDSCSATSKVGFMKTHKTASSTVQNILFRFGLKNHLTFALPSTGNYLGRYVKYSKQ